jgi:hypothetical protein
VHKMCAAKFQILLIAKSEGESFYGHEIKDSTCKEKGKKDGSCTIPDTDHYKVVIVRTWKGNAQSKISNLSILFVAVHSGLSHVISSPSRMTCRP